MIWFTLALFVVSFILTALLAPKPQFENARPDQLNPDSFPRATENAPIPLVLGKVRLEAPNTIWYGDFESRPITERVRVSLFKKQTIVVGHTYYLGLDLALAMGPRTVLREIYCDDKLLWSGTTNLTTPTSFTISQPSFFGGHKEGGGFSSSCTYYPGALDLTGNPIDPYLVSKLGTGNVPAYLGTAHIVFNQAYIGETASLRKMAFVLENYTNALGLPNNGRIGDDMNPAEAIYQIMTDTWRGMGLDPAIINVPQLQAIGNVLFNEGNGCSVIVTAESNGTQLIQEIFRQIDAIAYQDPNNGQINFVLIRDDYDVETLPVYDELDVLRVVNFSRSGWDEVVAQVKVTFPQRDRESDAVAISQDMATVAMIGRLRSTTISMPFVYDKTLAANIASRERAQLSVPLFRITLEMNRNAYGLRPGSVFKLDWPEYGFSGLVLRVQEFDLGSLLDGKIIVKCLQDSFSLATTVFAPPPDSAWVAPVTDPAPIVNSAVIEMPKFFAQQIEYPIDDGRVGYIPLAAKPGVASNAFDFAAGEATGVLDSRDPEYAQYVGSGVLTAVYLNTQGIENGFDSTGSIQINGANGSIFSGSTLPIIRDGDGGLLWINGEWLGFTTAVDLGGGAWTLSGIYRGLLGTRPLTHNIGTRVYQVSTDFLPSGVIELAEGATLFFKFLDRAGRKSQDLSEVSQSSIVLNGNVQDRPLRPGFLQLNGQRTDISINGFTSRTLTWRPRNRLVTQMAIEDDAVQTPDIAETYDVDVMINGVRNTTLSATGVTSPYTVPFNLTNINQVNCEFRVFARRTAGNLRSSATYAWLPFVANQTYSPPADPHIASVVLLIGAEGTNGSTTILDESPVARTLTANGVCNISTTSPLQQTSSLAVNPANESTGFLNAGASADFNFGTGDFTIEGWAQSLFNDNTFFHSIIGNFVGTDTGSWSVFVTNNPGNVLNFTVDRSSGSFGLSGTTDLGTGVFHFAISRNGTTVRLFVNGIMEAKSTALTDSVGGTGAVQVGGNQAGANDRWRGRLDEIRVTKGVGRYNADSPFTPQPFYSRS